MAALETARHVAFDEVDSTNAEAARRARKGERGPLWISARRQTAGRGRLGRPWQSPVGNLSATLLLTLPVGAEVAPQMSLVAGLAVFDAVASVAGSARLALKWPNDVLFDGRKAAGILVETVAQDRPECMTLAVGIGLNLAQAPEASRYGATCLAEHGVELTPVQALAGIAAALDRWLAAWNDGRDFAVVRRAWTARAAGLGGVVSIVEGGRTVTGIFSGLAEDGALIITEIGGPIRLFHAGEVSLSIGAGSTSGAQTR